MTPPRRKSWPRRGRKKWNKNKDATCWCLSSLYYTHYPRTRSSQIEWVTSPPHLNPPTIPSRPVSSSLPISRLRGAALFVATRRTLLAMRHHHRHRHTPTQQHTQDPLAIFLSAVCVLRAYSILCGILSELISHVNEGKPRMPRPRQTLQTFSLLIISG